MFAAAAVQQSAILAHCAPTGARTEPVVARKRVVILGGGFAGAAVAMLLKDQASYDITLIDKKPYFENTCAFHRVLVDPSFIERNRLTPASYAPTVRFVQEQVVSVIPSSVRNELQGSVVISNGRTIPFEYLIIATGTRYSSERFVSPKAIHANNAQSLIQTFPMLETASTVSVIGGGPVGVEVAAELCETFPSKQIVLLHSSPRLLSRMSYAAQDYVHSHLSKYKNVTLMLGDPVVDVDDRGQVITAHGKVIPSQLAYVCNGLVPNTSFMREHLSSLLDSSGYVRVNSFLQSDDFPNIFSIGDVAATPEEKLAQGALSHARIAAQNIKLLDGQTPLKSYQPPIIPRVGLLLGRSDAMVATGDNIQTGYLTALRKQAISLSANMLPAFSGIAKHDV